MSGAGWWKRIHRLTSCYTLVLAKDREPKSFRCYKEGMRYFESLKKDAPKRDDDQPVGEQVSKL